MVQWEDSVANKSVIKASICNIETKKNTKCDQATEGETDSKVAWFQKPNYLKLAAFVIQEKEKANNNFYDPESSALITMELNGQNMRLVDVSNEKYSLGLLKGSTISKTIHHSRQKRINNACELHKKKHQKCPVDCHLRKREDELKAKQALEELQSMTPLSLTPNTSTPSSPISSPSAYQEWSLGTDSNFSHLLSKFFSFGATQKRESCSQTAVVRSLNF
jgi:hypothetical protein